MHSGLRTTMAIISAIPTSALAFQNEPTGFRGIAWGTPVQQVQSDLAELQRDGDFTDYKRTNDALTMGGVELAFITYRFFRGRFVEASIQAKPGSVFDLPNVFKAQFGTPDQPNRFIRNYFWVGTKSDILVFCNEVRRQCSAAIDSHAFREFQRQDKAAKAAGAAKDF